MRAFEASQHFFDIAAEHLSIDPDLREALLMPLREVQVQVTIKRDDGRLANFVGFRETGFVSDEIGCEYDGSDKRRHNQLLNRSRAEFANSPPGQVNKPHHRTHDLCDWRCCRAADAGAQGHLRG